MRYPALPIAAALLAACGGIAPAPTTPATPSASLPTPQGLKAPGDAKVGDRTHCPVSGEEFTVKDDSPHADYQGKTYYFCCAQCTRQFEADPAKYTRNSSP